MNNPLVSIVVTCYNQEKYIRETLESVSQQTWQNWECIIVDDGSTDNSAVIIKEFTKKDTRCQYQYQENSGVARARNAGFLKSKGEFVQFLDGDDTLLPEKLKEQIQAFKNNKDCSVIVCDHQHYYEKNKKTVHYSFDKILAYPFEQFLFKWQVNFSVPHHSMLFRKKVWKTNELPFPVDYKYRNEDWVFHILTALKGYKYCYLDKILCNYHVTGLNYTSDSVGNASSLIMAALYVRDKIPKKYRETFIEHAINMSLEIYADNKKTEFLHNSVNWKVGNFLSKPFFVFFRWLKKNLKN